jgi:hypothetical protein
MRNFSLKIRKNSKIRKVEKKGGNKNETDSTQPKTIINEQNNNFNKIVEFIKKYNYLIDETKNSSYLHEEKIKYARQANDYKQRILSILKNPDFDLSILNEEDRYELLLNIIEQDDEPGSLNYIYITSAYLNIYNPYVTENILMRIFDALPNKKFFDGNFTMILKYMKSRQRNLPNIKNFLEDKLNIVDTFTSNDSPKLIELIETYINLNDKKKYSSRDFPKHEFKANYYKNTIISILNNPQLDLSIINDVIINKDTAKNGTFFLLLYIIASGNTEIINAYTNIQNPYITDDILTNISNVIRSSNNSQSVNFLNNTIGKMKQNKENFPNVTKFSTGNNSQQQQQEEQQSFPPRQSQQPVVNNYEELQNYTGNNCPSNNKEPTSCINKQDYYRQARLFHPDRNKDCIASANAKMKVLNNDKTCKSGGTKRKKKHTRKNKYMKNKTKGK